MKILNGILEEVRGQVLTRKVKDLLEVFNTEVPLEIFITEYPIVEDFKAGISTEHCVLLVSPKMYNESDCFLANGISHELGHLLAGHTQDTIPKSLEEVIAYEKQANDHAIKLFSKLYDASLFYYNHLDLERMQRSFNYYKSL